MVESIKLEEIPVAYMHDPTNPLDKIELGHIKTIKNDPCLIEYVSSVLDGIATPLHGSPTHANEEQVICVETYYARNRIKDTNPSGMYISLTSHNIPKLTPEAIDEHFLKHMGKYHSRIANHSYTIKAKIDAIIGILKS